jgi:hypothetical protein
MRTPKTPRLSLAGFSQTSSQTLSRSNERSWTRRATVPNQAMCFSLNGLGELLSCVHGCFVVGLNVAVRLTFPVAFIRQELHACALPHPPTHSPAQHHPSPTHHHPSMSHSHVHPRALVRAPQLLLRGPRLHASPARVQSHRGAEGGCCCARSPEGAHQERQRRPW